MLGASPAATCCNYLLYRYRNTARLEAQSLLRLCACSSSSSVAAESEFNDEDE